MEELIGRFVKAVFQKDNRTCAVRGILRRVEDSIITIECERDHNLLMIGKSFLVMLKELKDTEVEV